MTWLESLILGLVQGLTEYLPVSSSGHLEIANALFGIQGEENLTFAVLVHTATVCSTIVVLWKEVEILFRGLFRFTWNSETKYLAKIALSMIPVGIVGLFLKDYVESFFGNGLLLVGIMLLVTAALLTFAYYARPRVKEDISYRDAFIIGLSQAVAVLPGLSRSGTTIATGLMLGNKKEQVARFSFLMVIIPILGEALLDLMKGDRCRVLRNRNRTVGRCTVHDQILIVGKRLSFHTFQRSRQSPGSVKRNRNNRKKRPSHYNPFFMNNPISEKLSASFRSSSNGRSHHREANR